MHRVWVLIVKFININELHEIYAFKALIYYFF
jgi:hypothetical protein